VCIVVVARAEAGIGGGRKDLMIPVAGVINRDAVLALETAWIH
jgi:hypothetical protein